MTAVSVALDHYSDRARIAGNAGAVAERQWLSVDPTNLGVSWGRHLPQLQVMLMGAQFAATRQSEPYVDAVLAEQQISTAAAGMLEPRSLVGVASDGRGLAGLLRQPVVAAALAIAGGAERSRALAVGLTVLQMIVRTQVADAGRLADQVAFTARPAITVYTRMTVGKSCARCAILAGRRYRWSHGFRRHPRCDCIMIPTEESQSDDLRMDPRRLIESGNVTGLSQANVKAISLGADPAQVVNAYRDMYTAGGKNFTTESTTSRGSGPPIRLMPDQILEESAGDRDEALRLLRLHGYIR